jgi:hypothetical protein
MSSMKQNLLYHDKLIEISDNAITLFKYYFPSLSQKVINFRDIERVVVKKPTLFSGKWRIQGTGNFKTWYPFDSLRPKRDKIFIVRYKNKWVQSGFTVENSDEVELILKNKNLIK